MMSPIVELPQISKGFIDVDYDDQAFDHTDLLPFDLTDAFVYYFH